jgi:hypothetical protein
MPSDERIGRMLRASLPDVDWDQIDLHLSDTSGDTAWPSFASGVLLGLAFGAVVAFLLAPREGRRTRRQVWETTIELRSRATQRNAQQDETLIDAAEQAEVELLRRFSTDPS